jgi:hypothetical protein
VVLPVLPPLFLATGFLLEILLLFKAPNTFALLVGQYYVLPLLVLAGIFWFLRKRINDAQSKNRILGSSLGALIVIVGMGGWGINSMTHSPVEAAAVFGAPIYFVLVFLAAAVGWTVGGVIPAPGKKFCFTWGIGLRLLILAAVVAWMVWN